MKKNVIGISGMNATDNPGPGVAVARSLAETGMPIDLIGLSYDAHDPGNYMTHLFKNSFMIPLPSRGWDGMLAALYEVKHKTGLNILIPCLDAELPLLIQNQNSLHSMDIHTLLPSTEQFEFRSKDRLPALSELIGCKHPKTQIAYSIDELVSILKEESISLPVIIKGLHYKAHLVYNLESAILKGSEIAAELGFPLLIQEQIHGQEINLIALSDAKGTLCSRISIKKQLTTQLGKVWTAVTIRNEKLDELCDRFCKETKWPGPFELECICNAQGIYLIEINPRFPAWVYFATALGINLPMQLVELVTTGKCQKKLDYSLGKYLVRHTAEFISDLTNFQNLLTKKNRLGL